MAIHRAMVLGGSGFIGSHVVDMLLVKGWQVTVYDHVYDRYRPALHSVDYVIGELGNKGLLTSVLHDTHVAFHLISTTVPQSSNETPSYDIMSNLIGTVQFLEACVECRVGKVVFLSSGGTIYGPSQAPLIPETHPVNPITSYGVVKLAIEKYLHLFHHLYDLPYTILRPSNPYGPRQNPLGAQGAAAVFLGRVAQGLPITIWGDGSTTRDYFHVTDLARACLLAAESPLPEGIYNIGSGQGVSLNQLLSEITQITNRPLDVIYQPPRPFDIQRVVLDTQKAKDDLKWSPEVLLDEGILDTWQWVSSLPWLIPSAQ